MNSKIASEGAAQLSYVVPPPEYLIQLENFQIFNTTSWSKDTVVLTAGLHVFDASTIQQYGTYFAPDVPFIHRFGDLGNGTYSSGFQFAAHRVASAPTPLCRDGYFCPPVSAFAQHAILTFALINSASITDDQLYQQRLSLAYGANAQVGFLGVDKNRRF